VVELGDGRTTSGEVFDQTVTPTEDRQKIEELRREAAPLAGELARNLYPNSVDCVTVERFRSSGLLDPARMALYPMTPAIFSRYTVQEERDPRGRPVLVIACDGSSSLSDAQMRMTKVLGAAWLLATAQRGITVLSAIYTSDRLRAGVSGPVVKWIYHPRKSIVSGAPDAIRAFAALDDKGRGAQSDALSVSLILDEAGDIARGRMIYLILISDCKWNSSFMESDGGEAEMRHLLESRSDKLGDRLHTTLVALGVEGETGLDDLVNRTICVSNDEMTDHAAVANRIGAYVASCMREWRHGGRGR